MVGIFAYYLKKITESKMIAFIAITAMISTNPLIIFSFVANKPDGVMHGLASVAIGIYMIIVFYGLTPRRAVGFAAAAMMAFSSKEIVGPMLILPFIGLVYSSWQYAKRISAVKNFIKSIVLLVSTAVFSYAIINVIYAPETWWQRMKFWLVGPGTDPNVWASPHQNITGYLMSVGMGLLSNFGPGAVVLAVLSVLVLLIYRPRYWLFTVFPLCSFLCFGILAIRYAPDYFMPLATISTAPILAVVLSAFRDRKKNSLLYLFIVLCLIINVWYANISWFGVFSNSDLLIENHVKKYVSMDKRIAVGGFYPRVAGKSRLEALGYHIDRRPLGQLFEERSDLPQIVYISKALLLWIKQFKERPARAAVFKRESGYDYSNWQGFEALGYRLTATLKPNLNFWWYPFFWMPKYRDLEYNGEVCVYSRM
jgi:hypothetical protein